jgi:putative tryptophan/tyrosine transport system substrate-binding protein
VKRREFITLLSGAASWPLAARAQQPDRMRRVGVLMVVAETDPDAKSFVDAFENQIETLGWQKGRNLEISYRWGASNPERLAARCSVIVWNPGTHTTAQTYHIDSDRVHWYPIRLRRAL